MNNIILAVVVVLVGIGVTLLEHRRLRKKMKQEQQITLNRMEAEMMRVMNKMQVEHDQKMAELVNSQHMKSVVDPTPVIINQFLPRYTEYLN